MVYARVNLKLRYLIAAPKTTVLQEDHEGSGGKRGGVRFRYRKA